MPSAFKKALDSGKFIVTCEVAPSKGTNLENMAHHIDLLKDKVDAMNVTDHQSSVMRFPTRRSSTPFPSGCPAAPPLALR